MTQHGRVPVGYGARAALLLAIVVGSVAKAWAVHSFVFVAPDVSGIAVDSAMLVAVLLIASWPADDLAATIWTTIASALIAAWLVATAVYAHYFAQLLTFHTALSEDGNAAQVVSLLPDLLMKRHGLLFADTVVFGALASVIGIARRRVPDRRPRASLPLRVTAGALAVAVVTASTIYAGASSPSADHLLLAQRRGVLPSQIVSSMPARRYQLPPVPANLDPSDPAALASALDEIIGPMGAEGPERLRVPDGTNVIVVVFEGLQTMAIGASIDGEPVTPALTALMDESLYFPATFSQVGKGNTSDAEFTLNTGWYSPPGLAPSLFFADRELPGLPRKLSARGYTTATFHANDASFWNRDELYPALGFRHVYDRSFFGTEDMYLGWGVHDEDLFGATLPLIVDLHAEDEPFLAEIVTLSSHAPFSPTPAARQPIALPQRYRNTTAGDYVTAIHYADEQLGVFVESLEEAGVLDDTLLVVVGDHGGADAQGHGCPDPRPRYARARVLRA